MILGSYAMTADDWVVFGTWTFRRFLLPDKIACHKTSQDVINTNGHAWPTDGSLLIFWDHN
jgi:hypothetical protein